MASRARSSAGISVSIVTFELGTIWPMRMGLVIARSGRDDRVAERADALDGAFDDVARPHDLLRIATPAVHSAGACRDAVAGFGRHHERHIGHQLRSVNQNDTRCAVLSLQP